MSKSEFEQQTLLKAATVMLVNPHQRCGYSDSPFARKDTFLYCRVQKGVGSRGYVKRYGNRDRLLTQPPGRPNPGDQDPGERPVRPLSAFGAVVWALPEPSTSHVAYLEAEVIVA